MVRLDRIELSVMASEAIALSVGLQAHDVFYFRKDKRCILDFAHLNRKLLKICGALLGQLLLHIVKTALIAGTAAVRSE